MIYFNDASKYFELSDYKNSKNKLNLDLAYKRKIKNISFGEDYLLFYNIYKTEGIYDSALIYIDSAEIFYKNQPDKLDKYALSLLNKARINKKLNNPIESIKYLKKSLVIFNQLNDTLNVANVELNFGNVFKKIKKLSLAKLHYLKALDYYKSLNNKSRIADCYNNLGNLYIQLQLYDTSKMYFLKSIDYRPENNLFKAFSYHNISNLYIITKQLDSALYFINKSLNIKYKIGNQDEINSDYLTLGEIYFNLEDYKNANYYLIKCLNSSNDIYNKAEVEKVLSKCYFKQKKYKDASIHFNNYFNLTDSILLINASKELETQLIEYEFVKDSLEQQQLTLKKEIANADHQNLMLKAKLNHSKLKFALIILGIILLFGLLLFLSFRKRLKEEKEHKNKLEQQNEELKRTLISNEEKEVLLKEIHHRVKNNLQIINSLIRLQSHYMTPNNYSKKLIETENRIRSMALVHEKLYQSDELSKLNVKSYIKELVGNIYESYETGVPIEFKYEVSDLKYSIDTLIPIGLIINEVVSNSLKYAFQGKEKGKIYIKFCDECYDAKTVLIIKDDGIGADLQFEELSADSLGMELIESLTDQLDGKFELNTDNGFRYFFTFPTLK